MTLSTNPAQTTEPRLLSKSGLAWYSIVLVVSVSILFAHSFVFIRRQRVVVYIQT
jgi:hypothetical protein